MMAARMMRDSIGMHHVAARPGGRTKRDYRTGVLSGKHEVLIPERRCSANVIHCDYHDGEIEILSGVICNHHRPGESGSLHLRMFLPVDGQSGNHGDRHDALDLQGRRAGVSDRDCKVILACGSRGAGDIAFMRVQLEARRKLSVNQMPRVRGVTTGRGQREIEVAPENSTGPGWRRDHYPRLLLRRGALPMRRKSRGQCDEHKATTGHEVTHGAIIIVARPDGDRNRARYSTASKN